jgi:TM2 domain-containing membrane protein YozV
MNPSSTSSSAPHRSNSPSTGRFRSKTLTAALALFFGCIGAHRFYLYGLRDKFGWAASLLAAFLSAIVYGLRPDEKWDAQFNADTGQHSQSGWAVIFVVIFALFIGAVLLMSGLALTFQTYFESQVEAAKALSQ